MIDLQIGDYVDFAQTGGLLCLTYALWRINEKLDSARNLLDQEALRKIEHTRAFRRLTDPEILRQDMEDSARAVDMLLTERTTAVREDQQGQRAVVRRPKKYGSTPNLLKLPGQVAPKRK
jgi:hypothetical protein